MEGFLLSPSWPGGPAGVGGAAGGVSVGVESLLVSMETESTGLSGSEEGRKGFRIGP